MRPRFGEDRGIRSTCEKYDGRCLTACHVSCASLSSLFSLCVSGGWRQSVEGGRNANLPPAHVWVAIREGEWSVTDQQVSWGSSSLFSQPVRPAIITIREERGIIRLLPPSLQWCNGLRLRYLLGMGPQPASRRRNANWSALPLRSNRPRQLRHQFPPPLQRRPDSRSPQACACSLAA